MAERYTPAEWLAMTAEQRRVSTRTSRRFGMDTTCEPDPPTRWQVVSFLFWKVVRP